MASYFCHVGIGNSPKNKYQEAVEALLKGYDGGLISDVELFKENTILEIKRLHKFHPRCSEMHPSWVRHNPIPGLPVFGLSLGLGSGNFALSVKLFPVKWTQEAKK